MIALYLAGALVAVNVAVAMSSRRRFVRQRGLVIESWRRVGVELDCRQDLIAELVDLAQTGVGLGPAVLGQLAERRIGAAAARRLPVDRARSEDELTQALDDLWTQVEGAPDVMANHAVGELRRRLAEVEVRVADATDAYNRNARAINARVESFPSSFMAVRMHIPIAQYFELRPSHFAHSSHTGSSGR